MKKKLIIFTLILLILTFVGCTQKNDTQTPNSSNNNIESATPGTQTTNPGADNSTNNTNSMIDNTVSGANSTTNVSDNNSVITAEQAKKIALTKVPGATTEHIVKFKSETDDNRPVYDGTIHYNGKEYDFEIDAATGDVLEWDIENI